MKERPIIFSGEMVRAILEGRKTQTRRVVKNTGLYAIDEAAHGEETARRELRALASRCPYGKPGDRLWVRETWGFMNADRDRAWVGPVGMRPEDMEVIYRADEEYGFGGWRPPLYMPRQFSRILLEVADVRVERVNSISEEDAKAEGVEWYPALRPVRLFQDLWDSINAKRGHGWDTNPWVWVVSFKRVEPDNTDNG